MSFEQYFEKLFNKWWYEKMMNQDCETDFIEHQKRIHKIINSYRYQLSKEEKAMLKEMNRNCLLIDVRERIETKTVFLEAFDINNNCIFKKNVSF